MPPTFKKEKKIIVYRCFNEYGDPVSGNPVPSWGACESVGCQSKEYPEPLFVKCDGDTNTWTSDPSKIKCLGNLC